MNIHEKHYISVTPGELKSFLVVEKIPVDLE